MGNVRRSREERDQFCLEWREGKRKFILGRARWVSSKGGGIWLRPPTRRKSTEVHIGLEWAVLGETVSSVLCLLSLRCRVV